MTTNKNMAIWDNVSKTDPKHTKTVSQRGGFTAIDAMYQIQMATEQFGPAGKGWGWTVSDPIFPPNNTVAVKITLWHGSHENVIEQYGQKSINATNGKPDEDAFKKAVTDGLTKCLSYLGFNADVFLGKFDDNKYVQERIREEQENEHPEIGQFNDAVAKAKTADELSKLQTQFRDDLNRIGVPAQPAIKAFQNKLKTLERKQANGIAQ